MRKGPEEENSSVHFAKQDEDRVAGVGGGAFADQVGQIGRDQGPYRTCKVWGI